MKKLERYSIRGNTHSWLTSYLDDRFQYVQINNEKSQVLKVTYGATRVSVQINHSFTIYIYLFII